MSAQPLFKSLFLHTAKLLGLFALARFITRNELRILCYHGFSLEDEDQFRPGMFVTRTTLQNRLAYLKRRGYTVRRLDDALVAMSKGMLRSPTIVITIDDGFFSTLSIACKELRRHSLPATLYLTTYYVTKQSPVFRLAVQYMFWKTSCQTIDLTTLSDCGLGRRRAERHTPQADEMAWDIIRYGEQQQCESVRIDLARRVGEMLKLDFDRIMSSRILSLVSLNEARELASHGIDIQLHTHRHYLPPDEMLVSREIADNRAIISAITGMHPVHLCYPSGLYSDRLWPWLRSLGIQSATTCEPGLNRCDTNRLALRRILDSETLTQLEFDAEVSGFLPLLREGSSHFKTFVRNIVRVRRTPAVTQEHNVDTRDRMPAPG
jgi:peptidoglycan/xylan/chitin deacetylase (PgdA/CDA1 family)